MATSYSRGGSEPRVLRLLRPTLAVVIGIRALRDHGRRRRIARPPTFTRLAIGRKMAVEAGVPSRVHHLVRAVDVLGNAGGSTGWKRRRARGSGHLDVTVAIARGIHCPPVDLRVEGALVWAQARTGTGSVWDGTSHRPLLRLHRGWRIGWSDRGRRLGLGGVRWRGHGRGVHGVAFGWLLGAAGRHGRHRQDEGRSQCTPHASTIACWHAGVITGLGAMRSFADMRPCISSGQEAPNRRGI